MYLDAFLGESRIPGVRSDVALLPMVMLSDGMSAELGNQERVEPTLSLDEQAIKFERQ